MAFIPCGDPREEHCHENIDQLGKRKVQYLFSYCSHMRRRLTVCVRSRRPYSKKEVDRDMQPWFIMYFFDIGHLRYDQLTTVKI